MKWKLETISRFLTMATIIRLKKISPYTCKLENHADADDGRCIEDNDANICQHKHQNHKIRSILQWKIILSWKKLWK